MRDGFDDSSPSWAPDGSRLVFQREVARKPKSIKQLFGIDTSGGDMTQITSEAAGAVYPAWSPTSEYIVFLGLGGVSQTPDLFLTTSTGRPIVNITNSDQAERSASWSPDGRSIVFDRFNDARLDDEVVRMDLFGGLPLQETVVTIGSSPDWSSSGDRIAMTRLEPGAFEALFVTDLDGESVIRVPTGHLSVYAPDWQP